MRCDFIKLLKARNIPLIDEVLEPEKEYLIVLKIELAYIKESVSEPNGSRYFEAEIKSVEKIQEIGPAKKELKFEKGFSPSQRLRFSVLDWLGRKGEEQSEENYKVEIEKLIQLFNSKDI